VAKEGYEILKEGKENVMRLNYEKVSFVPSLEDSNVCMADVVGKLAGESGVSRIIFRQRRNYHYGPLQTAMLIQIATLYNHLIKTKKYLLGLEGSPYLVEKRSIVQNLINMLRGDPIGTYVSVRRTLREEKIINKKLVDKRDIDASNYYISLLDEFIELMERTRIIISVKPFLKGYKVVLIFSGSRNSSALGLCPIKTLLAKSNNSYLSSLILNSGGFKKYKYLISFGVSKIVTSLPSSIL